MPLRDHFRPPASKRASWEGFHGQWPAMIVQHLTRVLPDGYTAEPHVHLGPYFEIEESGFESAASQVATTAAGDGGGDNAAWTATQPLFEVEADWPEQYEYEVLVFAQERERR